MAQYLVGLDGGTTGCKTCIFDLDGKLVGSDYREYPSYYPEPGWVEQTTEDLLPNFYDSIKTAINKSGINPEDIIGFGFSSQGSVIGMLDENGELLRPWVGWQDLRGEGEGIEYLTSRIPRSEIYKQTGDPVGTTFSNAKLAWLKLHEPENWEKTALFSTMQDYFLKQFGADARILEAADKLTTEGILGVILLGKADEVKSAAKEAGFNIEKCQIIDPEQYAEIDAMVDEMVTLRKGKMTPEQVREALSKSNYFGTMLVKMGKADCLLGGATYSTADTVRPALQLIKTKPGNKIVSSCFIMVKGDKKLAMGDCAINIAPNEDELAEIAIETAKTAKIFGIDPKVAMLSYSTYGSGKGEMVTLMANATKKVKEMAPDLDIDGELQFDAAVAPEVAKVKCAGSTVAGQANTFIFPEISAGNIGYKIAARLGEYEAIGPVLQGLNAPINDLSRGCNAQEVYKMALVTAALS